MSISMCDGKFTGLVEDVQAHGFKGPLLEEDVEAHMPRAKGGLEADLDVEGHMPKLRNGYRWDVEDLTRLESGRFTGFEDVFGHGLKGPLLEEDVEAHMPKIRGGSLDPVEDVVGHGRMSGGRYTGFVAEAGLGRKARKPSLKPGPRLPERNPAWARPGWY